MDDSPGDLEQRKAGPVEKSLGMQKISPPMRPPVVFGDSFQSVHVVLSFTDQVPCQTPPPALLYRAVDQNASGHFAFANPDRVRGIQEKAGFGEINITALDAKVASVLMNRGLG
jgi:hypothetical protein